MSQENAAETTVSPIEDGYAFTVDNLAEYRTFDNFAPNAKERIASIVHQRLQKQKRSHDRRLEAERAEAQRINAELEELRSRVKPAPEPKGINDKWEQYLD